MDGPVKDKLALESTSLIQLLEQTTQIVVVGVLLKLQLAAIPHVFLEFVWIAIGQLLKRRAQLQLFDLAILFFFGARV